MSARTWLVFFGLGIVWGLPYLFIKLAVRELSPFDVAWGRVTLAALILVPIAWKRGSLHALRTHRAAVCAFALLEFALPYSALAASERSIPSSVAGILIALVPLIMVPAQRIFGIRERLRARRLAGLLLGILGVIALVGFGVISGVRGWIGVAGVLFVTTCYTIGPLIVQRHLHAVDSIGAVAASLLVASVVLLVPAVLSAPRHAPGATALGSVAFLGVVCTAVSMLGMFYLIKRAGAARTSLVTYMNPAVAALLGVGVLHERLGLSGFAGLALILLSVWLATRDPTQTALPAVEPG